MIDLCHGVSLVLGSASPRRQELLARADIEFHVRPAEIDETPHDYEKPTEYVRRLSLEKSAAVIQG
ncbi:MAG: septum formation inhibitor Maf, partial [Ilumatobacter sp.]|nr:septum formation inhibitor Maf [Ilumatobacter sp.]